MVNLTVSLSREVLMRLRRVVKQRYGSRRGALSGLVEEALTELLDRLEHPPPSQTYRAYKAERLVAEAENLEQLSQELKKLEVDPRSVRIISSTKLKAVARAGLRAREV
ncbi:MAG: hypothetical protein QW614_03030 [Candidatus Caldarchaeum sp.]|uniref:Uncharacterized protein n=1 Tax=Caldiarchaeum subterraneum TaxID=311458 RepID=A0A7C5QC25_CALS0